MNREIFSYLKVAAKIAKQGESDRSFFIGAVGIRGSDDAMVYAFNGKTDVPSQTTHCEVRLCKKLTPGSVVYVARILKNTGEFALARPCPNCARCLKKAGVKKVYYTIGPSEYGKLDLRKLDLSTYEYRVAS